MGILNGVSMTKNIVLRDFSISEDPELCSLYYTAFIDNTMLKSGFRVTKVETYGNESEVRQSFRLERTGKNKITNEEN